MTIDEINNSFEENYLQMTTFAERIKELAADKGLSIRAFEQEINASTGLIYNVLRRDSNLGSNWVSAILERWEDVNPKWLLLGIGNMYIDNRQDLVETKNVLELKTPDRIIPFQTIPYYNVVATAGILSRIFDEKQYSEEIISIPNMPKCDGALQITGDSMIPTLKSGDIVAFAQIHSLDYVIPKQVYIVDFSINDDDYLAIKRIHKSEKGEGFIKLVSDNPYYEPIDIPKSSIRHIALVKFSICFHNMI